MVKYLNDTSVDCNKNQIKKGGIEEVKKRKGKEIRRRKVLHSNSTATNHHGLLTTSCLKRKHALNEKMSSYLAFRHKPVVPHHLSHFPLLFPSNQLTTAYRRSGVTLFLLQNPKFICQFHCSSPLAPICQSHDFSPTFHIQVCQDPLEPHLYSGQGSGQLSRYSTLLGNGRSRDRIPVAAPGLTEPPTKRVPGIFHKVQAARAWR